ncbi:MAG TPA: flagellar hook-length control protein FliK [Methylocella sp.]|nr:flagellar hook-length control protein FliK [Methylocella sp.]
MKGIDGLLGKSSIAFDARALAAGAKSGEAGTRAESGMAGDFDGQLADLSRRAGLASDPADLASLRTHAVVGGIRQSFLIASGPAEAAWQAMDGPETEEPGAPLTIGSAQASGTPADRANMPMRSVNGPGGTPAGPPEPNANGVGIQKTHLVEGRLALGRVASVTDRGSEPSNGRLLNAGSRDSRMHSLPCAAETDSSSGSATGVPSLFALTATSPVKDSTSPATVTAAGATSAGPATGSSAMGELLSSVAPPVLPPSPPVTRRPPLDPVLGSRERAAEPLGSSGKESLPSGLAPGDGAAMPISTGASAARDVNGLSASIGPAPLPGEIALDGAAALQMGKPKASLPSDPFGNNGSDFAAGPPSGVLAIDQQTHLAPPIPFSPVHQAAPLSLVSMPAVAAAHGDGLVSLGGPAPLAAESERDSAGAQDISAFQASLMRDQKGGASPDVAGSAPLSVTAVIQQTQRAPLNRVSPAQSAAPSSLVSMPDVAAVHGDSLVSLGGPAPLAAESDRDSANARDITAASPLRDQKGGASPDFAASAPPSGTAVIQQTQRAPLHTLLPAQQIAGWVAAAAGSDSLDASKTASLLRGARDAADMADSPPPLARVQTMQVELDPGSLGKVTVSMRLSGTRLDLRVETEHAETMQLIGKDKDLLTSKLQAAGYAIESLIIQPAAPQAPQQPAGVNVPSNGQDPSTGQANGGPGTHDRPSNHDDRERSLPVLADDTPDGAGPRLVGGDLYL